MPKPVDPEWSLPTIDPSRCRGHGRCVDHCPTGAVVLENGRPTFVQPEQCSYCGLCEELCPEGAIALSYEFGGPDER